MFVIRYIKEKFSRTFIELRGWPPIATVKSNSDKEELGGVINFLSSDTCSLQTSLLNLPFQTIQEFSRFSFGNRGAQKMYQMREERISTAVHLWIGQKWVIINPLILFSYTAALRYLRSEGTRNPLSKMSQLAVSIEVED